MESHENAKHTQPRACREARQTFAEPAPRSARGNARPLVEPVQRAPDEKRPADAVTEAGMPQAADNENGHDIRVVAQRPGTAAAERDVEVVAEPVAERNVPARRPEFGGRKRKIGPAEILHQPDAEEQRQTDRDIGIAGEIAIDLEGEEIDRDQQFHRRRVSGNPERPVDHGSQVVRDHHLLEKAPQDELQAGRGQCRVEPQAGRHLLQKRPGALDRPREYLREPGNVERKPACVVLRGACAAINVYQVGASHEGVEGKAHRCGDTQPGQRIDRSEKGLDLGAMKS